MVLHFAYAYLLYILIPLTLAIVLIRLLWHKTPIYTYPLTSMLAQRGLLKKTMYKKIFFVLRTATLLGLALLIARPQWADERSKINVEGVDIVLAIDVSESMIAFDDRHDQRPRIDVAKSEAIRFIEKRIDDPIGIVIFGKEAVSRCPLTLDKHILKEIVGGLEIGNIDAHGTWLGTGLATAINRLRTAKAKSKIIILLTDGEPTQPEKVEPDLAIALAKKLGIKVYTIGIGSENGGLFNHPMYGTVRVATGLNVQLLQKIATETGGQFFRAQNPKDMRSVYDKIDALEKTKQQTNIFHRYYEAFASFIWIVLCALGLEMLLRFVLWRGVWG